MSDAESMIGSIVVAKFADGRVNFAGRVVSGTNRPTIEVMRPDGTKAHWIADLCEVITADEAAAEALISLTPSNRSIERLDG